MTRLFVDEALVRRMSIAGRQMVQEYDWRNIARRHVALYESLLGSRARLAA
jgi:glycosyltransferase involved in cell wall biosynthesis